MFSNVTLWKYSLHLLSLSFVSYLGKKLSGKPFYTVSGRIYCEDDFLVGLALHRVNTAHTCDSYPSFTAVSHIFNGIFNILYFL